VGLRLEYWLKAMQCFIHSPSITEGDYDLFIESVTEQAEFMMGVWNPYNLVSNWGVLGNHGLFIAGFMLPETARTKEFLNEAALRLDKEINMQVFRDGSHWEQSPMYHNEVLSCFLDVCLLAQRNQIPVSQALLDKTKAMCHATLHFAKPDHKEILMGDSDEIDVRDILSRGAVIFKDSRLRSGCADKLDFDAIWDLGELGLEAWKGLTPEFPHSSDKAFNDSGNFFFRSSWDENASFLHFHCGTLGAGHGHADKLHFDISSRGEDILTDAGRFTYVFGEDRIAFKRLKAHNSIVVDGKETYIPKDSWEVEKLGRAVNQKFFSTPLYGYAEGGSLSYISEGVFLNRRMIYIKPDIIIAADELFSTGKHSYTHYFHFSNKGPVVLANGICRYSGKDARAELIFMAKNAGLKLIPSSISRRYNEKAENIALEATFEAAGFASAYAVIGLSDAESSNRLEVEKVPVHSSFKGSQFSDNQVEALNIRFGESFYTVAIAHEEYATPTDSFNADGCLGFGGAVVFDRMKPEADGTVLVW
jgi:hypothetical protein